MTGHHEADVKPVPGLGYVPWLSEGYTLLESGDYETAAAFFRDAVERTDAPEALEALGMAAWLQSDEAAVFEARERAYELFRKEGDAVGAARVATWLAEDCFTFRLQVAASNGWLSRARTLLTDMPEGPEHCWLWLLEARKALIIDNDGETASQVAAQAVSLARRLGQTANEVLCLATEGIALVTSGRIEEGMGCLDEAATACISGDVDHHSVVSSVLCYMLDACDRVRDWDRAQEWFGHVSRLAERWNNREFIAQCRPHYAVVLTWRGDWDEAEQQLQQSVSDFTELGSPMVTESIVRLAELRWRQGRWDEAAALFDQVKQEPLAQVGQAALALDQGDPAAAMERAGRALRRLPPGNRIERMPALELCVRAVIAAGDLVRAREALAELEDIAAVVKTRPTRAAMLFARGLMAREEGALPEAQADLEDAVDLFEACDAPFESARARLELSIALAALGRSSQAGTQCHMALASLDALGATVECERARRLLANLETATDAGPNGGLHPNGLTGREVEVLRMVASGLSNQQIADELVLSIRTVQRHVENIYTKIGARGRAAAGAFAAAHGLV
jgi:LuxR family transcriptional regulator, maltose regulon positive regulatory protein